jgi:hypothetical protein
MAYTAPVCTKHINDISDRYVLSNVTQISSEIWTLRLRQFINALECIVTTIQPDFIKLTVDWQIVTNWYTDLYKNSTDGLVADSKSRPDGRGVQTETFYFTS